MTSPASDRVKVRRAPARGSYERDLVNAIFDEALICHVGVAEGGQPFVLPTIHARVGDVLYLHGAVGNRMLKLAAAGEPVCVTATIVDGLVLARSAFHHSMNYRSAVVIGAARTVESQDEKAKASHALVEHVARGRSATVRMPEDQELRTTRFVAVSIAEFSAKVRTGPPLDEEKDLDLPIWSGVLPLSASPGVPIGDPSLRFDIAPPAHVTEWRRP